MVQVYWRVIIKKFPKHYVRVCVNRQFSHNHFRNATFLLRRVFVVERSLCNNYFSVNSDRFKHQFRISFSLFQCHQLPQTELTQQHKPRLQSSLGVTNCWQVTPVNYSDHAEYNCLSYTVDKRYYRICYNNMITRFISSFRKLSR